MPDPVDIYVGQRVRLRRGLLGMSQEKLGGSLGLTFQQIQKYESGANRIGSSRLYKLSKVLDVNVSFFFRGIVEDDHLLNCCLGAELNNHSSDSAKKSL
jgi:transcriptional regulator with XRE-family HTH domain